MGKRSGATSDYNHTQSVNLDPGTTRNGRLLVALTQLLMPSGEPAVATAQSDAPSAL